MALQLDNWWQRIDCWISENRPCNAEVPGLVSCSEDDTAEAAAELLAPHVRLHLADKSASRSRSEPQNGPEVIGGCRALDSHVPFDAGLV